MSAYQRTKGAQAERDVCEAMRPWWPDVRRSERSGTSTGLPDEGDLSGLGRHLLVQVKDWTGTPTAPKPPFAEGAVLDRLLIETRTQARTVGAGLGILVEKRRKHARALDWWAWLGAIELTSLYTNPRIPLPIPLTEPGPPVRIRFGGLVVRLVLNGYAIRTGGLEHLSDNA